MAEDNIGLSGDALLKLNVIRGAYDDEISYAELEKHFGSIDQYTTSQYKWSTNWNTDQNAFATNLKQYIPDHMSPEDFKYFPTIKIDGKFQNLFDTPEFLDFYKKEYPDLYNKYGTKYRVGSMPLKASQKNRVNALYAHIYMMQAADVFKQNSVTVDFNKLSEKINAYKLSPEQEEDYQRRSAEIASEMGIPYKDPDGKYYFKYFDAKDGELLKRELDEGDIKKGKLKDG